MRRSNAVGSIIVVAAVAWTCWMVYQNAFGLSRQEVKNMSISIMEDIIAGNETLSKADLRVKDLQLFKQKSNNYRGLFELEYKGKIQNVGAEILVEDKVVMVECPPASFMFVAQDEINEILNR